MRFRYLLVAGMAGAASAAVSFAQRTATLPGTMLPCEEIQAGATNGTAAGAAARNLGTATPGLGTATPDLGTREPSAAGTPGASAGLQPCAGTVPGIAPSLTSPRFGAPGGIGTPGAGTTGAIGDGAMRGGGAAAAGVFRPR